MGRPICNGPTGNSRKTTALDQRTVRLRNAPNTPNLYSLEVRHNGSLGNNMPKHHACQAFFYVFLCFLSRVYLAPAQAILLGERTLRRLSYSRTTFGETKPLSAFLVSNTNCARSTRAG